MITNVPIIYLGPPGGELGFSLAGMQVKTCASGEEILAAMDQLQKKHGAGIVFVDEGLAGSVWEEIEKRQAEALISIVFLSHPAGKKGLAAKAMDDLMIRAVGADVLSNQ